MTKQTLLITGGAGFIGSSLIEQIIDKYKVVCIDNFNDYYNPHWKEENIAPFLEHDNFTLYRGDITDFKLMDQILKNHKVDKIVHLAARAGVRPSIKKPFLYEKVNIGGTLNLLELSKRFKIPHFIFASSSSVYGNQQKTPFTEADPVNNPVSPYAATKKAGEMLCHTYAHLYKIKMTCLRFFTVYGPKGRPDMAPYLFTKALLKNEPITKFGQGQSQRDYTYIDDIVEGIKKTIEVEFDFEIINLGNNKPVNLNQFIKTLEEITGKKANILNLPIQPGDVDTTYANISKAKRLFKWQPKTSLDVGLKKFVDWYQKHRV
jgi:UDP-glucuronate 4-epimerase